MGFTTGDTEVGNTGATPTGQSTTPEVLKATFTPTSSTVPSDQTSFDVDIVKLTQNCWVQTISVTGVPTTITYDVGTDTVAKSLDMSAAAVASTPDCGYGLMSTYSWYIVPDTEAAGAQSIISYSADSSALSSVSLSVAPTNITHVTASAGMKLLLIGTHDIAGPD